MHKSHHQNNLTQTQPIQFFLLLNTWCDPYSSHQFAVLLAVKFYSSYLNNNLPMQKNTHLISELSSHTNKILSCKQNCLCSMLDRRHTVQLFYFNISSLHGIVITRSGHADTSLLAWEPVWSLSVWKVQFWMSIYCTLFPHLTLYYQNFFIQ